MPRWLKEAEILHAESTVVELGCGITGLLGIILADKVSNYLLTDQGYVMKTLRDNVQQNLRQMHQKGTRRTPAATPSLRTLPLDWEVDSATSILDDVPNADHVDLVIVCDCVYNDHLVKPLVQTMVELCNVGSSGKPTTVMIAQQLRSDNVFEHFLEAVLGEFAVWKVPDTRLPSSLHSGSGYVVHLAQLKENDKV